MAKKMKKPPAAKPKRELFKRITGAFDTPVVARNPKPMSKAERQEAIAGVSPLVIRQIMEDTSPQQQPTLTLSPGAAATIKGIADEIADKVISKRTSDGASTYADGSKTYEEYVRNQTGKPGMTQEQIKAILDEQTGSKREWVMPDNSDEAKALRSAARIEETKRRIFAVNEDAPVTVVTKNGEVKTLAVYQSMTQFRDAHDFKAYPFKESRGDKDQTVILVGEKPWAGREKKPGAVAKPAGKTKAEMIGEMLLRPEGVTSKEVCEAMGWPSVSMPAQAKVAGMTLRKEKVDGVTKYWGIKS